MNIVCIHPIGYELRPHGHEPDMYAALKPYLEERGHRLIEDINLAHVILFDSEIWDLGSDGRSGVYSPYDMRVLQVVIEKKLPIAFFDHFDYWGTPKYGCPWTGKNDWEQLPKLNWNKQNWAGFMWQVSRPGMCKIIYFLRKMQAEGQTYPDWVFPLEYPLFDYYLPLATKEQLFARPLDLCLLANESQQRVNAMNCLKADGRLKVDIQMMPVRISKEAWVDRHRQAKMFVECDASMGSERPQRLITIAPMLRVRSDHRIPFPRKDMVHQVVVGDYDGMISKEDVDKILSVTTNPDLLHSIYQQGYDHMAEHYSMGARCNYIIDKIEVAFGK